MAFACWVTSFGQISFRGNACLLDGVNLDPEGHFGRNRYLCFNFLWSGKQDKRVMPWDSWGCIALHKSLGRWGLKNIFNFSKALTAKVGRCLISTTSL